MRHVRPLLAAAVLPALLLSTACVTINVYFPEAAVRSLSQAIEEEVSSGTRGPVNGTPTPSPQAPPAVPTERPGAEADPFPRRFPRVELALIDLAGSLLTPATAAAEVAPPEVSSPAIRKIIESRKARAADIDRYKGGGVLGESNRALLDVRDLESVVDLKERAAVQRLVKEENADREELFREIAAAKKVDASQLDKVRETYAETLREFARPGEWIQLKDGAWKKK